MLLPSIDRISFSSDLMATKGPRRSALAVPNALIMDKRRRELYVEGPLDRLFVLYVAGDARDENAVVQDIGDAAETRSDNKLALVKFAAASAGTGLASSVSRTQVIIDFGAFRPGSTSF